MFKKLFLGVLCFAIATPALTNEINVYSARKEQLIKPLLTAFSNDTGIKVNLQTGKDDALLERIKREGTNSPADLILTADAGRLYRAAQMGILQPVQSSKINAAVPANFRDPSNQWFGLSSRARVIFYNKDKVKPSELSTYEDLADPRWKGRICVRSSNSIYNQSLLASIIAASGAAKAQQWANGLVANFARNPNGGDRDQIKAVASGRCDIAIANTYYYAQMLFGGDAQQKSAAAKTGLFWPNQQGRGAHLNISGAGIARHARNKDNAIKLLEYMLLDDAQRWYSTVNGEFPVKPSVPASDKLQTWGRFKTDPLNLSQLGRFNAQAVKIMDKAGWK